MESQQILSGQFKKTCRICLDDNNQQDIISPCLCRGGSEYVHRNCLDNWRAINKCGRGFSFCDVCQFEFVIEPVIDDPSSDQKRLLLFYFLVIRDIGLAIILWQGILFGLAFAIQAGDSSGHSVRNLFPANMSSLGVYYLSSLIIFFAILGLFGLISGCCASSSSSSSSPHHHDNCCDCSGFECFFIGTQCNNCSDNSGCDGNNDDCGSAMLVVCLVILIAFAAIGLFVGVFLAIGLIGNITNRHSKKLWRRQEAKKYVVKDFQGRRHELSNRSTSTPITSTPTTAHENNAFVGIQVSPSAPIEFSSLIAKDNGSFTKINDESV